MCLKNFTFTTKAAARFLAVSLFIVGLSFTSLSAAKAQTYLVGQYTQSLQQSGSDAQAVESGQWYKTCSFTERLYVELLVDGSIVDQTSVEIDATGTPGDTVPISWTYPLTSGTHHVEFRGIDQDTAYWIWDDKSTMVVP